VEATALDNVPLFAGLTDQERAEVAASLSDVTVDAGTMVTVQGDNAWQLFVIESGEAEVRRDGEVVRTLGPGDVLGEIGLMATGTRTASVVATTPMQLGAMFVRDFKRLESRMPALAKSLRSSMADKPWVT
jgi:CRP-like cAMP-binding protein